MIEGKAPYTFRPGSFGGYLPANKYANGGPNLPVYGATAIIPEPSWLPTGRALPLLGAPTVELEAKITRKTKINGLSHWFVMAYVDNIIFIQVF